MKKLLSVFIALLLMIGMVIPAFTVSAEEVNKTSLSDAFSSVDNWTGATNYINTTDKVLFINDGWNTTNASIETIENYDFGSVLNANFGLYYSYPNDSYHKDIDEYSIKIGKFEIIIGNYQNKITVTYDGNDIRGTCEILNEVTGNDVTLNYSVHIEPGKISIASENVKYESSFSDFEAVNNAKVSINQKETWHIYSAKFSNLSIAKQNSNFVADFSDSTLWSGDVTAINTVDKWFGAKSGFNNTTDGYGWNNKPATVTTKLSYYFGKQFDGDFSIFTGYANGSYYDESGLKANKENEDFKIQIGDFIISVCDYQTRIKVTYKGADIPGKSHCSDYNYYTDFKRNYSVHVEKGYILIESENVVYHSDFENFDSVDNAKISLNLNETWQLSSGYITAVSIEGNTAELVVGDCDQDGKLTSLDLVNVRKILLLDLPIKTKFADINRDGFVNILDLVRLKKLLVSLGINDLESSFTSDFTDVEKWNGDTANINTESKYFGTVGTFSNTNSSIIAKDKVNLGNGFVSEFGIRTYYSNDVKPTDDHFDVQIGDFKVVVSAIQNQIQLFYGDTEIGNVSNEEYTYPADPKVYTYELYVVPGFISVTQKSGDNILLTLSSDFSEFSKLYSEEITLSIFETWQIWDAYFTNFSVEAITPNASEFVADFTTTDSWNGDTQFVVADKGFGSTDGWGTTTGTVTSTSKYDFGTKFDGTFTMYTEYSNGNRINSNEDYYIEIGSFKIAICDYQTRIKVYYNGKDIGGTSICSNNTYVTPVTKDYLIHIEPGNISIKSDIVTYTSVFSDFSAVNNVSISLTKNETWQIHSAFIKSLSVSSAQKKNLISY